MDVLSSHDGGATWSLVAAVAGMYWANLFLHDGAAYLLGTGGVGGGAIAIARSEDGGSTWRSAELFRSPDRAVGSYATGATPLLVAQGRLWRAFELWRSPHRRARHASCACSYLGQHRAVAVPICGSIQLVTACRYSGCWWHAEPQLAGRQTGGMWCVCRWPQDFEAVLASAAEGSDLMNPASWAMTPPLAFDDAWLRGHGQPAAATAGYLEGDWRLHHPSGLMALPAGSDLMQQSYALCWLPTSFRCSL